MGRYKTSMDICPAQVACDGLYIKPGKVMCAPCERALEKRNSKPKPLKGEQHLAMEATKSLRRKEKLHGRD